MDIFQYNHILYGLDQFRFFNDNNCIISNHFLDPETKKQFTENIEQATRTKWLDLGSSEETKKAIKPLIAIQKHLSKMRIV